MLAATSAATDDRLVTVTARAKVNLALHVTGRRSDGYHELDSIVAFAALEGTDGDRLTIRFGEGPATLVVTGPFAAGVPVDGSNSALAAAAAVGGIAAITLEKNLPVAAGIGGGSADAAAVLRAAAYRSGRPLAALESLALGLGADVPVCLHERSARMRGIGERLTALACPVVPALLVNPGVEVSTPAVFRALTQRQNPPLPDWPQEAPESAAALAGWLGATRNDLEPPARSIAPVIGTVVDDVAAAPGCLLVRMSGSGATVFGLFATEADRDRAADRIAAARADWWVGRARLGGDVDASDEVANA